MGRYSYSPRRVLEESAGIRIQDLKNYGVLNKGKLNANWTYNLTQNGRPLVDVDINIQFANTENLSTENYIHFDYLYKGQQYSFKHLIEIQSVNLGGYRYFFRCNCKKNNVFCGKRVKALYFAGNVWACRHCLELVYQNCRYNKNEYLRLKGNAETLKKKAEILRSYNHPKQAKRLEYKSINYEIEAERKFLLGANKLLARLNKF